MFGPHTRRRAVFAASRSGGVTSFGFRRAQSHDIIDLRECPVLLPRFEAAIPALRELAGAQLHSGEARIGVTACDNGFDVAIEAGKSGLRPFTPALGRLAVSAGIVRLTAGRDPLFTLGAPVIGVSGVDVELPPGAFLQAAAEAEAAMTALAVEAFGKVRKAADLFCGLGAFAFAMARRAQVTAAENDRSLLAALQAGARRAQGLKPITVLGRDLMREPLSPAELNAFDAVLFDPPRAGAIAQAQALAKSRVGKVVAVSCNPASFARDAAALILGGYSLDRVTPIDQFVFSPHLELVAVFSRK
jgi:23S rRNA (uracil1939-C5)-methyltransferase